jgi:type VI secretion system protein ImpL
VLKAVVGILVLVVLPLAIVIAGPGREPLGHLLDARSEAAKLRALGPDADMEKEIAILSALDVSLQRARKGLRLVAGERVAGELTRSANATYLATLRRDFALPSLRRLAEEMGRDDGYYDRRERLATYLMLGTPEHVDEAAFGILELLWEEIARKRGMVPDPSGYPRARPLLEDYLSVLQHGEEPPLPLDAAVVADARAALSRVPGPERVRSYLYESLRKKVLNPFAPRTPRNMRYRALTLQDVFADRPDVLRVLGSRRAGRGQAPAIVDGIYTQDAYHTVLTRSRQAPQSFASRAWVVPPAPEEQGDPLLAELRRAHDDYARRAVVEWTAFFEDIEVKRPRSVREAMALYQTLSRDEPAYVRLVKLVVPLANWPEHSWSDLLVSCGITPALEPLRGMLTLTDRSGEPESQVSPLERWAYALDHLTLPLGDEHPAMLAHHRDLFRAWRDEARKSTEADLAKLDPVTRRLFAPLLLEPLEFTIP